MLPMLQCWLSNLLEDFPGHAAGADFAKSAGKNVFVIRGEIAKDSGYIILSNRARALMLNMI